jgi:serine/threonine protein phosphatase 1
MIYVSSDWHGCPLEKIKELLAKANFGPKDFLFVLGDVIDRGEHSVELLKWLMVQDNVQLIRGNHEEMMLACSFLFDEVTKDSLDALSASKLKLLQAWQMNGGDATINALKKETPESRADILDFLSDTPLYDSVSVCDKDFLLVHSGLGRYSPDKKISDYGEADLLWTRPYLTTTYSDKFTTVLGHTPTVVYGDCHKGKILVTDTWINVDTGSAMGLSPALLRLDDMCEFYA